jgi:hypothetical protein
VDINIPDNPEKGNPMTPKHRGARSFDINLIFIALLIILIGIGGYGLGRLKTIDLSHQNVTITPPKPLSVDEKSDGGGTILGTSTENGNSAVTSPSNIRKYVGARGGKAYYLPSCPAANRIAEKNKIWFSSKEEAERLGYKPATNCKGI